MSGWLKKLAVFIDPSALGREKELRKLILQDLEESGLGWSDSLRGFKRGQFLPNLFILSADSSLDLTIDEKDIVLVLGNSNTNLFGERQFASKQRSVNSPDDWKNFFEGLERLIAPDIVQAENRLRKGGLALLDNLAKGLELTPAAASPEEFMRLEEELLRPLTLEEAREILPKASLENLGVSFRLERASELDPELKNFFPFVPDGRWFLVFPKEAQTRDVLYVYALLENILGRESAPEQPEHCESLEDMQFIMAQLPMALALFDENQELLTHNPLFMRLNLSAKNCFAIQDEQQFQREGELYRAQRRSLDRGWELFFFFPVREFLSKSAAPSSTELGIISSSVAHELNNPLAGVSGALDVLLLEEEQEQRRESLLEMKAGVSRCKKLVETFLGFSKLEGAGARETGAFNVESCLNSAMELARFRLIENNISMDLSYEREGTFSREFNPHILSMTIYLVLGELLTSFSRQKLVAEDRSVNFQLKFVEHTNYLSFDCLETLRLSEEFMESKLFVHLLETQNLRPTAGPGRARLEPIENSSP